MNQDNSRDTAGMQWHRLAACSSLQNASGRDRMGSMPALLEALPPDFCLAKESYVIIIDEQMKHLVLSLQPQPSK